MNNWISPDDALRNAYGENPLVYGAVVGNFHQRIANAHVVVLITAHKAAQLHSARQ